MKLTLYDLYQKMLAEMGPTHWWPADSKEQILVEAILIQNTTEANAIRASKQIKEATGYELESLLCLPQTNLEALVRPAGFMKNKSKALQAVAAWYLKEGANPRAIVEKYGGTLRKVLLGLHGVGPETADVLLVYMFDQAQFVADKYARTLFRSLGVAGLENYQTLHKRVSKLSPPFTYRDAQEFHGLIDEFGKIYFRSRDQFQASFLAGDWLDLGNE